MTNRSAQRPIQNSAPEGAIIRGVGLDASCNKKGLPLSRSVMMALKSYLQVRQQAGAPNEPSAGLFWQQRTAGRYSYVAAGQLLRRVLRRAGFKTRTGPRVHDLRHAFVVNRMLAWYREGVNPQPLLPYLATYLGHKDINSTLVYLSITQELLQQASARFRVVGAAAWPRCEASLGSLPTGNRWRWPTVLRSCAYPPSKHLRPRSVV
jgi:integrase